MVYQSDTIQTVPNLHVEGQDIIQFPQLPVTVATPQEIYTHTVLPQTTFDKARVYLAGFVTSGGAINIPEISNDIPRVIRENAAFAVAFWHSLLKSDIPLPLPGLAINDLRSTQMLAPHTLGNSAYPKTNQHETTEMLRWGEYDFYAVWYSWILGVKAEMMTEFITAMLAQVDLPVLKNHGLPRSEREKEALKIADNISTFYAKNGPYLDPIDAMISLPNPDLKITQSIGTKTEQKVVKDLGIPSLNAVIHVEKAQTDSQFSAAWETLVGGWMIKELQNKTPVYSVTGQAVSLQPR